MMKNKIRPTAYDVFPMTVVLVGADVKGKANFKTIAWVGIVEHNPPLITISSNQNHYTNIGIKENQTFSINIPTETMVEVTDYCGLKSGKNESKADIFEIFYGSLKTAPMIKEAPINLECKLIYTIDTRELANAKTSHDIFIGKVINTYSEKEYLTHGMPDVAKIKSLIFSVNPLSYWTLGKQIGKAYNIGNKYKREKEKS